MSTHQPPNWEGLYSFRTVWQDCMEQLFNTPPLHDGHGTPIKSGADGVALQSLTALTIAHPIYIGTEQITALPPVETDAIELVRQATLPFPTIYLDFASARGPARLPVFLGDDRYDIDLFGCIVADEHPTMRLSEPRPTFPPEGEWLTQGRTIIPFGCGMNNHPLLGPSPQTRYPANSDGSPVAAAAPMGLIGTSTPDDLKNSMFGVGAIASSARDDRPTPIGYFMTPFREAKLLKHSISEEIRTPLGRGDLGYFFGGTGALIGEALRVKGTEEVRPEEGFYYEDEAMLQALMVYGCAEYAARCLYLLDSANVTLAQAPVSRQVRRAAERRGGQIASIVAIRRTQIRRARTVGTGQGRNFSHRFERRGHYRHITRGPHFKPDHVKPCDRRDAVTGEPTCPQGCRREYVPPHWVGSDQLPMVPKSRRLSIPPPEEGDSPPTERTGTNGQGV